MDQIVVGLCRPIISVQQPDQTGFLGFDLNRSFEEVNYHTYVMEAGKIYKQTTKGIINVLT